MVIFSVISTQNVHAEKTLTVTQKCENTLLQLFITNQDDKPVKNAVVLDKVRMEVITNADEDGFLILPADLQGSLLRVGGGSYTPTPFTAENCQSYEIEFEKSDHDLVIVNHHTWSNFDPTADYGDGEYHFTLGTGNYVVGEIVNLSEHNLTDIKIGITSSGERLGTIESKSLPPMKKILRPGESSPFFAYMRGGFDTYSIRIDDYKGTSGMPVIPQVKISDVVLNEDSKGNSLLTIICTDTLKKSDNLRLLLMGYSETNYLESASLTDEYLFSLSDPNASDCITDGKITLSESINYGDSPNSEFVEYAKNDRFEVFIIQSGYNLFYDVQEINRTKNLNAYENKPVSYTQAAVYSNYFPNSLTPKHINIDNLKSGSERLQEIKNLKSDTAYSQNKSSNSSQNIPTWIKNNAEWWSQDKIDDATFVSGIKFLIKNGILDVVTTAAIVQDMPDEIPSWIKTNAQFWAQDLISDDDFLNGIQYLVEHGIIKV